MFIMKPQTDTQLQTAIDGLYEKLAAFSGDTEEFSAITDQIVKLYALKEDQSKSRVSPDTLAMIAGNILGILLIVGHERAHIVTSKALGFVMKLR
jgi:hypothetical protein